MMDDRCKSSLVGSCQLMCPDSERLRREREHQLHKFEVDEKNKNRADPKKCVKEFTRAAAGQATPKPNDLRPPSVLMKTVDYLFTRILTSPDVKWIDKYDFTFDRLRSVRQDMVFQDVFNLTCARTMESIVRFHIYSIYKSLELSIEEFDPYINETHLRECLKRLLVFYSRNSCCTQHRPEIETYYMLFHLGSNEVIQHWLTLPESIKSDVLCQKAAIITHSWLLGNYVKAFRIIKALPFLCCVTLIPHIANIRRHSIRVMNTGYSMKNSKYPLCKLTDILLFDDVDDAAFTCKYYGIIVDEDFAYFLKQSFLPDRTALKSKRYLFIDKKHDPCAFPDLYFGDK